MRRHAAGISWRIGVGVLSAYILAVQASWAATDLNGRGRYERIKGQPGMGYMELYEANLFVSPASTSISGPARRLGTTYWNGTYCNTNIITGDGAYCVDGLPAGTYSLLLNQSLFFITPKVVPNVALSADQKLTVNVELPVEYSTNFRADGQWTVADTAWYQTFIATGTSVRGVSFVLAGTGGASDATVDILKDDGTPDIRNWRLLGTADVTNIASITDNWVRFRSGEVPLIPGAPYAVRVHGNGGTGVQPFKRDKDANSYAGGQAHNGAGQAQPFDLNCTVFGDNDGTRVTMNKRNVGIGQLCEGNFSTRWGQTFIARGNGLAGVDVWAAGANNRWDLQFQWLIRAGSPTGTPISSAKITESGYQAFGAGLHGVAYNPGEVPLTAGQTYFVEFNIVNPPSDSNGFNPYMMNKPAGCSDQGGGKDSYADGIAYRWNGTSWDAKLEDDVNMTIVEYQPAAPIIAISPETLIRSVNVGNNLPDDTFTVRNAGQGTLSYTISDNASWLSVSPVSGSSTGESDTITLQYNVGGLTPGDYTAIVTVLGAAANGPQTATVRLTVIGPRIELSTNLIERMVHGGGTLANDSFTVRNAGAGTLIYTIGDNAAWLSAAPTGGTSVGEADSIGIQYAVSSLPFGTYAATIVVSAAGASNSPQNLSVLLTVAPVKPDFDHDGDVDQLDFSHLQRCLTVPDWPPDDPACLDARLDNDEDVDQFDVQAFAGCFTGPNLPANPNCLN
jgi:hypothetical protein